VVSGYDTRVVAMTGVQPLMRNSLPQKCRRHRHCLYEYKYFLGFGLIGFNYRIIGVSQVALSFDRGIEGILNPVNHKTKVISRYICPYDCQK